MTFSSIKLIEICILVHTRIAIGRIRQSNTIGLGSVISFPWKDTPFTADITVISISSPEQDTRNAGQKTRMIQHKESRRIKFLAEKIETSLVLFGFLTLPIPKGRGFLLQPLLHWPIPYGIAMSYTVSTS